jgi:hypothetical protein
MKNIITITDNKDRTFEGEFVSINYMEFDDRDEPTLGLTIQLEDGLYSYPMVTLVSIT